MRYSQTDLTEGNEGNEVGQSLRYLRFLLWKSGSVVGTRQDHPVNAVDQLELVGTGEQANGHVQELHVAEQLRLVNRENLLHRLQFEQETAA